MINKKAKGSRHEYAVRDLLRGFGWKAERTPLSGAINGWKQDVTAPDCPLFIECKNVESVGKQFLDWHKKTADNAGTKSPVVVWTKNGEDIYAFILFTDLLQFVKKAEMAGFMFTHPKFAKPEKKKKIDLTENLKFPKKAYDSDKDI